MLKFLSTLFSTDTQRSRLDEDLINVAIERAVDGTDKRLRGFGNYQKRLKSSVEMAVQHVMDIVDSFPEPVEISSRTFRGDRRLRAFFASVDHMRELAGGFASVQNFLDENSGPTPEKLFGLLSMEWREKLVLGMDMHNDMVRREVMQATINFFNHKFLGPTGSEEETRWELKKRAFDFLVEHALEKIVEEQGKRGQLKNQHRLLQEKLTKMREGDWGLGQLTLDTVSGRHDLATLESEIAAIEAQILELAATPASIEDNFKHINEVLGNPSECLFKQELVLSLNEMQIKTEPTSDNPEDRLDLTELRASNGAHRVVFFGWMPTSILPEKRNFLDQAAHYLG